MAQLKLRPFKTSGKRLLQRPVKSCLRYKTLQKRVVPAAPSARATVAQHFQREHAQSGRVLAGFI